MFFVKRWIPKLILSVFSLGCVLAGAAQDAAAAQPAKAASTDQFVILLGIIALILAFVIYGLGQVLLTMGSQLLEKNKHTNKILLVIMVAGLNLLSLTSNAQDLAAAEAVKVVPNYSGLNSTAFWLLVIVLITEVVVIAFMMFSIQRLQSELLPQKPVKKGISFAKLWTSLDSRFFTKAVAVEKEADVMLDHDYDGIRELDNSLPPWWKYGFMITIVVAVVYMLNFHVLGYGKNPTEEYQAELVQAQKDKAEYEAKNKDKIDESDLKMPAADGIAAGREIYTTACWACHGKEGEGGAGPNLTDDYWIHKGSLSDVFKSIKKGYPDKGMQAWEKNYSPKEINNIAGFIKTMRGSNPPNGKVPQGDLFTEEIVSDSSAQGSSTSVITKDSSGFINAVSEKK